MKICPICNQQFEEVNGQQIYCSQDCRKQEQSKSRSAKRSAKRLAKWEAQDHIRKCLVCGKEFELQQNHTTQKYCCKHCRQKAERLFGSKSETDIEYKDKIRFSGNKYFVLERDEYQCKLCGNKHQLVIHHIDCSGQSEEPNNDIDNLITLCRKCHINVHRYGIVGSTGL